MFCVSSVRRRSCRGWTLRTGAASSNAYRDEASGAVNGLGGSRPRRAGNGRPKNMQRRTAGLFVAEDKGAHALKGVAGADDAIPHRPGGRGGAQARAR